MNNSVLIKILAIILIGYSIIQGMLLLVTYLVPEIRDNYLYLTSANETQEWTQLLSLVISVLSVIVSMICGVGLFKRFNWARILLLAWICITLVFSLTSLGLGSILLVRVVLVVLVAWILYNRKASVYFNQDSEKMGG